MGARRTRHPDPTRAAGIVVAGTAPRCAFGTLDRSRRGRPWARSGCGDHQDQRDTITNVSVWPNRNLHRPPGARLRGARAPVGHQLPHDSDDWHELPIRRVSGGTLRCRGDRWRRRDRVPVGTPLCTDVTSGDIAPDEKAQERPQQDFPGDRWLRGSPAGEGSGSRRWRPRPPLGTRGYLTHWKKNLLLAQHADGIFNSAV